MINLRWLRLLGHRFRGLGSRLRVLLRRRGANEELDEELRIHLELRVEENLRSGMSEKEARRQALIAFGGVERYREQVRDLHSVRPVEDFLHDIRFALRSFAKRPLFPSAVIALLGVGIGGVTLIFTIVDAVLLKELPFPEPRELVSIWETRPEWRSRQILRSSWDRTFLSYPDYQALRSGSTAFQEVAIYGEEEMVLTGSGNPADLIVGAATASLADVLGIRPVLGRWFLPGEDGATATTSAVISHGMWSERFGEDPEIIGKSIVLNDLSYTVAGVLPPGFRLRMMLNRGVTHLDDRPAWVPVGSPDVEIDSGNYSYEGIARLAPGVTLAQAQVEATALFSGVRPPLGAGVRILPRMEAETGELRFPLHIIFAATGLLLLIACGNAVTLLLGEAVERRREMAVRMALGAGRRRIVQQALSETVLLGILGSMVAVVIAYVGTEALLGFGVPLPRSADIGLDARVLVFAGLVGVGAGAVLGILPSALALRGTGSLQSRVGSKSADARGRRLQQAVVAGEIALTVMLLVSGGLLARTLQNLLSVDVGIGSEALAVVRVSLPRSRYPSPEEQVVAFQQIAQGIEAIPSVRRVSGTHRLPYLDRPSGNTVTIEGRDPGERVMARVYVVLPELHEVLGTPIVAGRGFSAHDAMDAPPVMMVSETMAQAFWPGEPPLGARVNWSGRAWTVVGIAGDVRHTRPDVEPEPAFYVPHAQAGYREMTLVASTDGDPRAVLPLAREAVWDVDPDVPVTVAGSMGSLISSSVDPERFRTLLLTLFGLAATLLAVAGVFGTTARSVAHRARELGIRSALGARPGEVVGSALGATVWAGVGGVIAGLVAALWVGRLLGSFLYGVEPWDPLTFGAAGSGLLLLAVLSAYLPARRAATLPPMEVLAEE